jgi:hypothetical protein
VAIPADVQTELNRLDNLIYAEKAAMTQLSAILSRFVNEGDSVHHTTTSGVAVSRTQASSAMAAIALIDAQNP